MMGCAMYIILGQALPEMDLDVRVYVQGFLKNRLPMENQWEWKGLVRTDRTENREKLH